MVGRPRKDVIDESEPGIYHVFSRCVRRAFLCGLDAVSGKDFSHRRDWIIRRIEFLCRSFAIEACSFAVLSNHYHLLLRNRPDLAGQWSDEEVARRWWRLNPERRSSDADNGPTQVEIDSLLAIDGWVDRWRKRLASPSCFMQYLNQNIARRANREDRVKGHFFQERFGARRMDSDLDSLVCSLYIDLNELRAGLADCLENSRHSSVVRRLARLQRGEEALLAGDAEKAARYAPDDPDFWLCPVDELDRAPPLNLDGDEVASDAASDQQPSQTTSERHGTETRRRPKPLDAREARFRLRHGYLPVTLTAYAELLDHLSRQWVEGKQRQDPSSPPILERLRVANDQWSRLLERTNDWFQGVLGRLEDFERDAGRRGSGRQATDYG